MNKIKVILLLKTFSKVEFKRFGEFLKSPYFNKNTTLIKYFDELKKHYPEFSAGKASKEIIYKKIFKSGSYNEQVMKNLTSELYKLCREFLIIEFKNKDGYEKKLNLLRQLIMRKADSIFHSEQKIFKSELMNDSELSEKNFYYLYQLEDTMIGFHLERNEQPLVFDRVLKSGEYLILFFLINLSKTISNLNVNMQSFNVDYPVNLPQEFFDKINIVEIIDYMRSNSIGFSEIAELYLYRVICNRQPYDEQFYYKFKELVLGNINRLGRIEIYGLFNALETFCLIKINSGGSQFNEELFNIFNLEIEKGFYKYSETSPVTYMKFRNTYLAGLALRKYDWVEHFIEKFKNELIETDRENIITIANAQLEFEKGNFEKVLESISTIEAFHNYSKIDLRNLTLMCYYELNYIESALSMIDSYKHFLTANKSMPEVFQKSHKRFLNSFYSLINYKIKGQKDKLIELRNELVDHKNERRVNWLIEKIDDAVRK